LPSTHRAGSVRKELAAIHGDRVIVTVGATK
jgi:hypothetical protein